jgi:glycosyltransferase involved in cell wall biosynthesis
MKIIIKRDKASSVLFNGQFYDTGVELDLSFSEAFRLSRVAEVSAVYDNVPYDPSLWKNNKFINFYGDIDNQSGFGNCSYYLIKESAGALEIAQTGKTYGVRDHAIFSCQSRQLEQAGAMVWHDQPRESWLYTPFKKNIAVVPWETTKIPESWVARLNTFDALLVPCKQNVECFRDSGVTIPTELIHWGVDPNRIGPIQRPERSIFTFGHMGALSQRKGTDLLVEAFTEAFPTETDVRLINKTSYNTYPYVVKDKRIKVLMTPYTPEELIEQFWKEIDCFVFPTRGEGFGLTPLEAMATGVPAIVTGWSGPMEYMDEKDGWLIDYQMTPATSFSETVYKEDCGNWAEPSKKHLIELMQYAYHHQDEVKEKGRKASERIMRDWTWANKIKMFHQALAKHL